MLKVESNKTPYHGWLIEIVTDNLAYGFHAYHPQVPGALNDGGHYPSFSAALIASYQFVDREVAIQALTDLVENWLETGTIDSDEYWNLTNFS